MNFITQFLFDILNNALGGLPGLLVLLNYMKTTPLDMTTGNPFVMLLWHSMVIASNGFLGLYVVVKVIQIMYGQSVGAIQLPISQLVPKVIRTAILINLSAFLGTFLITLNNLLCSVIVGDVRGFVFQEIVNGGTLAGQEGTIALTVIVVFVFYLLRIIFQIIRRVMFFNVLYILSGPAFVLSLDAQTAPWFSFWGRSLVITSFTQFLQFLAFSVGVQFLDSSRQTGSVSFILATAVLGFTAEIPTLLSRFAPSAGDASAAGMGALVRSAVSAVAMLA